MSGKREKTWKREIGIGALLFIFYLALTDNISALEILAGPVFLYLMGAFGLDAVAKQIQPGMGKPGRPRRRYDYDPDELGEMGEHTDCPDDRSGDHYSDSELYRK